MGTCKPILILNISSRKCPGLWERSSMNKFRLLKADEIECRIARVKPNGVSLLLYKTARTDANLLDEIVGEKNWQNDFKIIGDVLYGGIGIRENCMVSDSPWIWKWDAGTESYTEAEKGRASDAFKRAGFKWGIGRELYTAPFIWIGSDKAKITEGKCFDEFEVEEIGYNEKEEISRLKIINSKTRVVVFNWEFQPMESFSGEDKITALKVKSLTSTCKEDGIPIEFILKKCKLEKIEDMREEQFANVIGGWEKVKAQYKDERKNS